MYNEVSTKDRTLRVYRLLRTWDEASATWNQASSGANWQTAGADGSTDRESTAIGSRAFASNESTGEKQFSLDAAKVQEWISGGLENRGMIVIADTERDDQYYFRSSDYTTASQRPKLVIVYTLAQGSAAPMDAVRANVSYSSGFQSSGESKGNGPAGDIVRVVKARPRQVKGLRMQLSLVRETGVVWRSYYFAEAARIAMRQDSDAGSEVIYLFSDHLGSTSVTYRASDGNVDRQWYKPWGQLRPGPGSNLPTDYQFTGQRNSGWGLYYFKARWFDSNLGRFAQADTIIPTMGFSIAWDRYAGMLNNPLKYVDPSGYRPCDGEYTGDCSANDFAVFRLENNLNKRLPRVAQQETLDSYNKIRHELFISFGDEYLQQNGKIKDQALLAILIFVEFSNTRGDDEVYGETKEALSNQYHSTRGDQETPCKGTCSLVEQLIWLKGKQGFRVASLVDQASKNFLTYNHDAEDVKMGYSYGLENSSWEWGNAYPPSILYTMISTDPDQGKGIYYVAAGIFNNEAFFVVSPSQNLLLTEEMKGW
jgi:RHS repeat-associated protein